MKSFSESMTRTCMAFSVPNEKGEAQTERALLARRGPASRRPFNVVSPRGPHKTKSAPRNCCEALLCMYGTYVRGALGGRAYLSDCHRGRGGRAPSGVRAVA